MPKTKHNPNAAQLIEEHLQEVSPQAREICYKLREIIFKAIPDIIEDWKWGPIYYKDGMLCGYGAFKNHVKLAFFKGAAMKDPKKIFTHGTDNAKSRGLKFKSLEDIDEATLLSYLREAALLNTKGVKVKPKELAIPSDFLAALKKAKLLDTFEKTNYTNRKEYIHWIEGAKKQETRERRLGLAIEKIGAGEKFS